MDDAVMGVRYLLAVCSPPDPGSSEPDADQGAWAPLFEDPTDDDPIVECRSCPADAILADWTSFAGYTKLILKYALNILDERQEFDPVWPSRR